MPESGEIMSRKFVMSLEDGSLCPTRSGYYSTVQYDHHLAYLNVNTFGTEGFNNFKNHVFVKSLINDLTLIPTKSNPNVQNTSAVLQYE